jgi:hypothetical protein
MIKILNLVLYSDNNDYYKEMFSILNNFYNNFNYNQNLFVKTYYYKYNNNIQNDIELIDNIINIKGEESIVPGALEKTLIALKYIENEIDGYDYVIRSNISTIIDFNSMSIELEKKPIMYGSTLNICLIHIDIPSGITTTKYFNTWFASGTNIIISKQCCKMLINNIDLIDKTIIDDVAFGILFKKLNINCELLTDNKFVFVEKINDFLNKKHIVYSNNYINNISNYDNEIKINDINDFLNKKHIAYRNTNYINNKRDYDNDIGNMKIITSELLLYYK